MIWPRVSSEMRRESERAMKPFVAPIAGAYAVSRVVVFLSYLGTGYPTVTAVQGATAVALIGLALLWWRRPPRQTFGAVALSTAVLYSCALFTEISMGADPARSMIFLYLAPVAAALIVDLLWLAVIEAIVIGSWVVTIALGYLPSQLGALTNGGLILLASCVLLQLASRRQLVTELQLRKQRQILSEEITARKELENHIIATEKFQSLGPLAAGLAHDINNLMTTVSGYAEVVRDQPDHPDTARSLEWIMQAAHRASSLADELLTYSGKQRISRTRLDLIHEIRGLSRRIEATARPGIEIVTSLPNSEAFIESDRAQLQQLVSKLVKNAVEAIGDVPGRVNVTVEMQPEPIENELIFGEVDPSDDAYHSLVVEDTGSGIEPELLAKIFDPFFMTHLTDRGLGLAPVLGIAIAHDGAILVRTSAEGTRFRVFLPKSREATDVSAGSE